MRSNLIIDFSSRNIVPTIITPEGRAISCTLRQQGITSRYFPGETYLDPGLYQKSGNELLDQLNDIIAETSCSDIFFSGKSLGWFRPYQISAEKSLMPVSHPLYALSSHRIPEGTDLNLAGNVSSAFLTFLLQPVMISIREMGFQPEELNVIALVPAYLSRLGEKILYKTLKKKIGFPRVILLNHATALGMHFLKSSYVQKVGVMHTDENALFISKIEIERENEDHAVVKYAGSASIKEAGWDSITNEILFRGLDRDALPSGPNEKLLTHLNRSLSGLFGSVLPPASPRLHLSYGLLTEKLAGELGSRIRDETSVTLRKAAESLELNDAPFFITAGSFFMIGQFEKLMLEPLGKCQPARVRHILAMERKVYGIAAMLDWLRENENRRITVRNNYSVRIAEKEDESIELIPDRILRSGERFKIRQVLALDSDDDMDKDVLVVDILWGNNPVPKHNTSLCTLSYDVTGDDIQNDNMLELMFDLKATAHGLKGKVTATLGDRKPREPEILDFTRSSHTLLLNGL